MYWAYINKHAHQLLKAGRGFIFVVDKQKKDHLIKAFILENHEQNYA